MSKSQRVRRLEAFRFSSYPGYVKAVAEEAWICYGPRKILATSDVAARRHYRAFVHACVMEDDRPLLEVMRTSRHAVGSEQFVERIEREFKQRRTGRPTDRDLELPREQVDLERISRAVAAMYEIDAAVLRRHGGRAGEAKAVALELACRHTGLNQRQIGRHYGKITSMAVCMARRRFREDQAQQDPALRKRLARLEEELLAQG